MSLTRCFDSLSFYMTKEQVICRPFATRSSRHTYGDRAGCQPFRHATRQNTLFQVYDSRLFLAQLPDSPKCSGQPHVISDNAQFTKDFLAALRFEFFFRPMDPTASNAQRMRCQHQILHDQTAVAFRRVSGFVGENDQNNRSAIEGVDAFFLTGDCAVHLGKLVSKLRVSCGHDNAYFCSPFALGAYSPASAIAWIVSFGSISGQYARMLLLSSSAFRISFIRIHLLLVEIVKSRTFVLERLGDADFDPYMSLTPAAPTRTKTRPRTCRMLGLVFFPPNSPSQPTSALPASAPASMAVTVDPAPITRDTAAPASTYSAPITPPSQIHQEFRSAAPCCGHTSSARENVFLPKRKPIR